MNLGVGENNHKELSTKHLVKINLLKNEKDRLFFDHHLYYNIRIII